MNLQETNFRKIYRAWKANLGVFEPFMRSGPFVSLQTYLDFNFTYSLDEEYLNNKYKEKLDKIIDNNLEKTFIIIDSDMNESLELAYLLNNKFNIKPIINFNFLFHPYGLVGSKESIERLVVLGKNLATVKPTAYLMFLDYERYGDFSAELYKKKINNQYEFSDEDLPYGEMLKKLGYTTMIICTKGELKEDLKEYADSIKSSLSIEIIKWG